MLPQVMALPVAAQAPKALVQQINGIRKFEVLQLQGTMGLIPDNSCRRYKAELTLILGGSSYSNDCLWLVFAYS